MENARVLQLCDL